MLDMKKLEKQRVEKIQSLNQDQVENYVDFLISDICNLHDFHSVTNPDERMDEITNLYNKLAEVGDLTIDKFNQVKGYIKMRLDNDLLIVYTVNDAKDAVDYATLKNLLISLLAKNILNSYVYLEFYLVLFHGIFKKCDFISQTADADEVNKVKDVLIKEFQMIFPKIVNDLNVNIEKINGLFYPDDVLIADIKDMKKTLREISKSNDEYHSKLKKYGIITAYNDLIKCYSQHMELKKLFDKYSSDAVDLLESDNVFFKYSKADYETLDIDMDFDEFMKSEPKFNLINFELKES